MLQEGALAVILLRIMALIAPDWEAVPQPSQACRLLPGTFLMH